MDGECCGELTPLLLLQETLDLIADETSEAQVRGSAREAKGLKTRRRSTWFGSRRKGGV